MIPGMLLTVRDRRWGWFALFGVALLLTASRASMLALAAAGGLYGMWRLWKGIRLPRSLWFVIGIGGVLLLPVLIAQFLNSTHGAASLRLDLWQVALKAFRDHPIVGIGPESYEYAFHQYAQLKHDMVHHHAHNVALQVAAETGLIGLAALAAVLTGGFLSIQHAVKEGSMSGAVLLGVWIVALCVQGTFDYVYWVSGNVLIVIVASWLVLCPAPTLPTLRKNRALTWAGFAVVAIGMFFVYYFWVGLLDEFWPFHHTMIMGAVMVVAFYGIMICDDLAHHRASGQPTP
jgi:O-antigen ligase